MQTQKSASKKDSEKLVKSAKSNKTAKSAKAAGSAKTGQSAKQVKTVKTVPAITKTLTKVKTLNSKPSLKLVNEPKGEGKKLLGTQLSPLELEATNGKQFSIKKGVLSESKRILYFYPKDSTPGCTIEGLEFNKLLGHFKKLGYEIYGISRDSLKSHDNFQCKQGYKFELVSDPDEKACKLFDVIKEKNMYGKKVMGIERSTFVLNEKNEVVGEFRKVKAEGHAQEILDFVKTI